MLLEEIHCPADVKKLSLRELTVLAGEIREEIVHTVARHGGHLASNLGAVELTLALHYVFDCPEDKLVFDVGHQAYAHKMLTGRLEAMRESLREEGGVSGFPRALESDCDAFTAGHASTAISAALGMARTRDVMGDDYHVVAVVGDGALTGGMCYEALNDAGQSGTRLIVVINDNEMSISHNVGRALQLPHRPAPVAHLPRLQARRAARSERIPGLGAPMFRAVEKFRDWLKTPFVDGKFFDALGFRYIGPLDGHDLKALIRILRRAKEENEPQILHVVTVKGKGYTPAESHPDAWHGVAPFLVETGEMRGGKARFLRARGGRGTERAGGKRHPRLRRHCGHALGHRHGGLWPGASGALFRRGHCRRTRCDHGRGYGGFGHEALCGRVFDVFAARVDQIATDVCIGALPVTFLIDRAGLVGADGVTHQGVFDLSYLSMLPNMVVAAPRDVRDLKRLIRLSASTTAPWPFAIPRTARTSARAWARTGPCASANGNCLPAARM